MNLLFNDATGNVELKELLGFLDLDLKFQNIKSFIVSATNDIVDLIGLDTYNLAVAEYVKQSSDNTKNTHFIFMTRFPIALQAYRKFAPHNDISHTNKGRLNRIEENEKSPFEWMIEKDNQALERRYYEALDGLIKYLDDNVESWKETDNYKLVHSLFVSTAKDYDDIFPINNSRLLLLKLAPGIRRCENKDIKSRIGIDLFNTLKATPNSNPELLQKIKEACIYSSLAWGMRRLSAQMFPEGVLQSFVSERLTISAKKAPENNEALTAAHYFDKDAKEVLIEIEGIIEEINLQVDEVIEPLTFDPDSTDLFINT